MYNLRQDFGEKESLAEKNPEKLRELTAAWEKLNRDMIAPLWGEKDEKKRIDGYKKLDKYIADNALVLPILQYHQPVVHRKGLKFTPHTAGFILPQNISPA